jgi:hypothetical protein
MVRRRYIPPGVREGETEIEPTTIVHMMNVEEGCHVLPYALVNVSHLS